MAVETTTAAKIVMNAIELPGMATALETIMTGITTGTTEEAIVATERIFSTTMTVDHQTETEKDPEASETQIVKAQKLVVTSGKMLTRLATMTGKWVRLYILFKAELNRGYSNNM